MNFKLFDVRIGLVWEKVFTHIVPTNVHIYCATPATVNTRQNFWHFFDMFLTSLMTDVILAGKLGGEPAIDLLCRFSFSSPFVK